MEAQRLVTAKELYQLREDYKLLLEEHETLRAENYRLRSRLEKMTEAFVDIERVTNQWTVEK